MCIICTVRQGTPTNLVLQGTYYYARMLCMPCLQLACLAYRHPQIAQKIAEKLA